MTNEKRDLEIWTDDVRLAMIEKSKFYPDNAEIYQYGYYDGYLKGYRANTVNAELIDSFTKLLAVYRNAVKLYDPNHHDAYSSEAHNAIVDAKNKMSK